MPELGFFRARADEALLQADEADLPNVRERSLRAAAAWELMAIREERFHNGRVMRGLAKPSVAQA